MATIQVTDKWRIVSDSFGWRLQKKKELTRGGMLVPSDGWAKSDGGYVTLAGAISGLRDVLLRESNATDIKQLRRDAKEIAERLEGLEELMEIV